MRLPEDLKNLKALHDRHKVSVGWKVAAWLALCYSLVGTIDYKVAEADAAFKRATERELPIRPRCYEYLLTKADQKPWKLKMCKRRPKLGQSYAN